MSEYISKDLHVHLMERLAKDEPFKWLTEDFESDALGLNEM
jgi:hypothetical protein